MSKQGVRSYTPDSKLTTHNLEERGKGMRVIVADDQPEVRSALRLLLEEKPGIDVIAEVRNAKELLRQVKLESPELVLD
jgi:CheY-like chemotaxis protein